MKKEIKMHLDRIQNLKNLFSKYEIDALIIPSCDEFQNSFIRENRAHLEWFSGFTGSNGSLIITESFNIFLTDGRYIDQSKKELKISCEIFNIGSKDALGDAMKMLSSMRVGYFSELNTCKNFNFYRKYALQNDFQILPLENDAMLDFFKEAWSITNTIPTKVYDLELKYSGTSVPEKIEKISSLMSRDANYIIISDLNEIAWTLNLRGRSDVPFTPVFFSRLIIGKEGQIFLFTESNVNTDYAKQNNIEIKNLTEVYDFYKDLLSDGQVIQFDYESTPARFLHMSEDTQIRIAKSPVDELKSVKNATELQGMKDASFLEGVAICKLFCWMYRNIGDNITEIDASNKLEEFRKQSDLFLYPSFQTISAFGENASIIHYKPNENTNKTITGNDLYLIDAGGQYFCGTTDATRVICFGTPTDEQRINFTNVLKGYIRLANAKFPKRTICAQLDALARFNLWECYYNYPHATGHGVGHFLSVHDGHYSISPLSHDVLKAGMVISNEPGYYKSNSCGIRIESVMHVIESNVNSDFLEFEVLTMLPISTKMTDLSLLTAAESRWLSSYNHLIRKRLSSVFAQNDLDILFYEL